MHQYTMHQISKIMQHLNMVALAYPIFNTWQYMYLKHITLYLFYITLSHLHESSQTTHSHSDHSVTQTTHSHSVHSVTQSLRPLTVTPLLRPLTVTQTTQSLRSLTVTQTTQSTHSHSVTQTTQPLRLLTVT